MIKPGKLLRRRLLLILLLAALALLRAESGTAEIQGRTGQPTRMFHLAHDSQGWQVSLLGYDSRLPASLAAFKAQVKKTLP